MVVTLDAKRRLTVPTALAPATPGDYSGCQLITAHVARASIRDYCPTVATAPPFERSRLRVRVDMRSSS